MIDSPTTTQRESELQLTAVNDWGAVIAVGSCQGLPTRPLTMIRPASAARATELPTATHSPTAVHDTPVSEAHNGATVWLDQTAPPFSVVKIKAWPVRALVRVSAVVPTTVQRTPATPTGGAAVVVVAATVDVVVVVLPTGVDVVEAGATVEGVVATVDGTGMLPLPVGDPAAQETPFR